MEMKIIGIIAVILIIAIGGALTLNHRGNNNTTTQTTSQGGSITQTSTTSQTQTTDGSSLNIEGTWHGAYKGAKGSGEWKWVIKKTGMNTYTGCLQTTGTYIFNNGWMPITVTLNGDKIEIGSVGPNTVIFSGTISGNKASGSWHFSTNYDSGSWEGVKESSNNELPCMEQQTTTSRTSTTTHTTTSQEATTTTTQSSTTTTSQTSTTTTTQTQTGIPMCETPPPSNLKEYNDGIMEILASAFGSTNIFCNAAAVQGNTYNEVYTVNNIDPTKINDYITQIVNGLSEKGWVNITVANGQIYALSNDQNIQAIILMQLQGTIGNIAIQIGPS